jgi:hypothetical protein
MPPTVAQTGVFAFAAVGTTTSESATSAAEVNPTAIALNVLFIIVAIPSVEVLDA